MYYIIRNDGSSIFEQPYPYDFCLHCLFNLIDNPDPNLKNCKLVHFELARCIDYPLALIDTRLSAFSTNCEMRSAPSH